MNWLIASVQAAQDSIAEGGVKAIDWVTWCWVVGLGGVGGITSFYRKLRQGQARPFNIAELLGELLVSAFVGLVTFLLCKGSGINEFLTAGLVGLTGHMGTRALMRLEKYLEERLS